MRRRIIVSPLSVSTSRTKVLGLLGLLLALGLAVGAGLAARRHALPNAINKRATTATNGGLLARGNERAHTAAAAARMENEVVTINMGGFWPKTITRPEGPFTLIVLNKAAAAQVQLQLNQASGAPVRNASLSNGGVHYSDIYSLAPGRYVLTEAHHPDWSCQITITP